MNILYFVYSLYVMHLNKKTIMYDGIRSQHGQIQDSRYYPFAKKNIYLLTLALYVILIFSTIVLYIA